MTTPRNLTLLGLPNYGAETFGVFGASGAPEPALMTSSKLKTEEPTELARMTTLDPIYTQWTFTTNSISVDVRGFSVVNHNFAPNTWYRILAANSAGLFSSQPSTAPPTAIEASTNITGGVTNVDEAISSADGLIITPTVNTNMWSVRLSWGAFSPTPKITGNMSSVVINAKLVWVGSGATSPITAPSMIVELWEGGVFKSSLGQRAVNVSSANQILIFPFDFSSLTATSGANLEIKVTSYPGSSTSGSSYATMDTISIYYESSSVSYSYDSGWIQLTDSTSNRYGPDDPVKLLHYIPSSTWTIAVAKLLIRTDQANHDLITFGGGAGALTAYTATPKSYIEAGVWCIGNGLVLSIGLQEHTPIGSLVEVTEVGVRTLAGNSYSADLFRERVSDPIDVVVTRDELVLLQNQLAWKRGKRGAFYVAMEPDLADVYQQFTAFWCTLESMSVPRQITYSSTGSNLYSVTLQFREKL